MPRNQHKRSAPSAPDRPDGRPLFRALWGNLNAEANDRFRPKAAIGGVLI